MNKKQLAIYHKGAEAFRKGKGPDSCPYKKTRDIEIWNEGYIDADAQEAGETE